MAKAKLRKENKLFTRKI